MFSVLERYQGSPEPLVLKKLTYPRGPHVKGLNSQYKQKICTRPKSIALDVCSWLVCFGDPPVLSP